MTKYPTELMFYLPYTPRSDSNARGYEEWIRDVDMPFFNSVAEIAHYSNWRVDKLLAGTIDFTHFDFMFADPQKVDMIWSNKDVAAFAAGWNEQWGRDPQNADLSVNYHVYRLEHEQGGITFDRKCVTVIYQPAGPLAPNGMRWNVSTAVLGQSPCTVVDVIFGPIPDASFWAGAQAAFTGTLVAAP